MCEQREPEGSQPHPGSHLALTGLHQVLSVHLPCLLFTGVAPISSHTWTQVLGAQVQLVLTEQTKDSTGQQQYP